MNFKGSKTEKNLFAAFAGESQARNKYTFFSDISKKEGYEEISDIFKKTSDNEKAHAFIWFKFIHENKLPTTIDALKGSAGQEHAEWSSMYKKFAEEAKEEGFIEISKKFEMVGEIERHHEERFRNLINDLDTNTIFNKETDIQWICKNCGHIHTGKNPAIQCPVCGYPKSYFSKNTGNN